MMALESKQMNSGTMIQVLHSCWDNICQQGLAVLPDGRTVHVKATWAHAPMLSMYNLDDGCWIPDSEWEWNYTN